MSLTTKEDLNLLHKKYSYSEHYLLESWEKKHIKIYAHRMPHWIETYHLTLMTLIWSSGVLITSLFLNQNKISLLVISIFIILQYITDILDGEVGRVRGTGLIQWGFYMDHLMDYIFLSSVFFGYVHIFRELFFMFFLLYIILIAFMIHFFLTFSLTGKFRISAYGVGTSELRFVAIIFNTLIMFNRVSIAPLLMIFIVILFVILCFLVYIAQHSYFQTDKQKKYKYTSK